MLAVYKTSNVLINDMLNFYGLRKVSVSCYLKRIQREVRYGNYGILTDIKMWLSAKLMFASYSIAEILAIS